MSELKKIVDLMKLEMSPSEVEDRSSKRPAPMDVERSMLMRRASRRVPNHRAGSPTAAYSPGKASPSVRVIPVANACSPCLVSATQSSLILKKQMSAGGGHDFSS